MTDATQRHDISDRRWTLLEPHLPGHAGQWDGITRDNGTWEALLNHFIDEPDDEWLLIEASHCKVYPHATGARGGNQGMGRTKGGATARYIWLRIHMVYRCESLLQRVPARIAQRLAN